jgi:lysozyme family protein
MSKVEFTDKLKKEYQVLFDTCNVNPDRINSVDSIISKILTNKNRYETVGNVLGIPWYFIAVIHNMESSLNFTRHLHNGDPLTARTIHVPRGRPPTGSPPFTWEESAEDALKLKNLNNWKDWTIPGTLYKIEEYNGWGYRKYHPSVLSPYLWSFSNHYSSGKYVADGNWSDTAKSEQCGAAVILKRLAQKGIIMFPDMKPYESPEIEISSIKVLKKGMKGDAVKLWQEFLTSQGFNPGIDDGIFGEKTRSSTIEFQKKYKLDADGIAGKNTFAKAKELGFKLEVSGG